MKLVTSSTTVLSHGLVRVLLVRVSISNEISLISSFLIRTFICDLASFKVNYICCTCGMLLPFLSASNFFVTYICIVLSQLDLILSHVSL